MSHEVEFNRNPFDWSTVQEQHDAAGNLTGYMVPAEVMRKLVQQRQEYWDSISLLSLKAYPPPTAPELEEMRQNPKDVQELVRAFEELIAEQQPAEAQA